MNFRKWGLQSTTFQTLKVTMNSHLKAYGFFLAFAVATKILVVPLAKQMGIPFVQDL